jgi:large subunit ribosomal protein L22
MLRIVGTTIPDDVDVFTGLRMVKGLDSKHSRNDVERILVKAQLCTKKLQPNGKFAKEYPKVGDLSWKEKRRLIELVDMPRAVLRNIRISPSKLRLVADVIRGKHVDEALGILSFLPKAGAPILHKLLKSAIANAGNNHDLKADNLVVSKILIDGGTTLRRFMARARGRACRIRKRTSHAIIVLREKIAMSKVVAAASSKKAADTTAAPATKPAPKPRAKKTATAKASNTKEGGK